MRPHVVDLERKNLILQSEGDAGSDKGSSGAAAEAHEILAYRESARGADKGIDDILLIRKVA
jgi:hypothetical protein